MTVSVKELLWEIVPQVAVTMTVDVTGVGGAGKGCPPPPPQQVIKKKLSVPATASRDSQRGLLCLEPNNATAITTEVTGTNGNGAGSLLLLVLPEYPSVRVDLPLVEMKPGLNVHDPPAGSPEHDSETLPMKPFAGVTVSVLAAVSPTPKVNVVGASVMLKSGGNTSIEYVAVATALGAYPFAYAIVLIVWLVLIRNAFP